MIPLPLQRAIRRAIKDRQTIRAIAKSLKVTEHIVRVERIKMGDAAPDNRTSQIRAKVHLLTRRGWSAAQIAEKLQVSATVVYRYRREIKK